MEQIALTILADKFGTMAFTSREAWPVIKEHLPADSPITDSRLLGMALSKLALAPEGDIRVVNAGYNSHAKVQRWSLSKQDKPAFSAIGKTSQPGTPVISEVLKNDQPGNTRGEDETGPRNTLTVYGTSDLATIWVLAHWYDKVNVTIPVDVVTKWVNKIGIDRAERAIIAMVKTPNPVKLFERATAMVIDRAS